MQTQLERVQCYMKEDVEEVILVDQVGDGGGLGWGVAVVEEGWRERNSNQELRMAFGYLFSFFFCHNNWCILMTSIETEDDERRVCKQNLSSVWKTLSLK